MAGNYPDVPSWRMAIDRDGTIGAVVDTSAGTITQLDHSSMVALNNETGDSESVSAYGTFTLAFIFPEKRDIDGFFFIASAYSGSNTISSVQVSTDTTNGFDGTWTQISGSYAMTSLVPGYRSSIKSATALAVRGIRMNYAPGSGQPATAQVAHLYGEIAPGENPDRLALWHPTLNQRITPAYFDWGNVPRSSSADKQFRVKNLSSALTANSVRVAMDILTDTSPSVVGQMTMSSDGGTTFLPQVNVGNLAPGAISGIITQRRNTPSNATLSLWAYRTFAEANSWS